MRVGKERREVLTVPEQLCEPEFVGTQLPGDLIDMLTPKQSGERFSLRQRARIKPCDRGAERATLPTQQNAGLRHAGNSDRADVRMFQPGGQTRQYADAGVKKRVRIIFISSSPEG